MSEQVDRLVEIISQLREHCAWTAALTHESLVQYLLEESYELTEAIETHAPDAELEAELGDILLQVVLHAAIGEERRAFDLDSVAAYLGAKMIRRNTHVFNPDGSLKDSFPESIAEIIDSWDRAKRAEKPLNESAAAGLPSNLPALLYAQSFLSRTARHAAITETRDEPVAVGKRDIQDSVRLGEPLRGGVPESEQELGEHLLALCAQAQTQGLDAERALRNVVQQRIAQAGAETQETTS
ncbi:nucleotide pyrophosphohydrolase [Paeniglutamicibacter sp. ZC-3]|uniref:MazG nucleotide pyrophosphohydrolase domain-containing protein n=1 Tax=Paeniglutamicibacter sp. ZC-3 TaxID=2986919 RepID=UPI0021F7CE6E|nr:MazG nucleotide pyrophosphohydrolase domain-containing protein [Paeniglutamicibacter sp. ZC-3]MCV9992976.1 nucleotide pyrophosphohydrolase [Paeniglutamicibacter sp. ZC-3]